MQTQKELTSQEEMALIQKKLKHFSADEKPVRYWLDTGEPLLNAALGSPTMGLAYGKIIGLDGFESHGKSLIAQHLGALAQRDGADVGWLDPEDSLDEPWATKRGLDWSTLVPFKTRLLKEKEDSDEIRLITAQELCQEAEEWILLKHKKRPNGRIFLGVDSVTSLLTEREAEGGIEDQNMNTNSALASFMSKLLRRWVGIAATCNVMMVLINQVRLAPNVRFGNPEYNPGGKALQFYASVLARVRKPGGDTGRLFQDGKAIGMQGTIRNIKNKAGEGSQPELRTGFKVFWDEPGMQFLPHTKIQKDGE